jgi:hypothetical protein
LSLSLAGGRPTEGPWPFPTTCAEDRAAAARTQARENLEQAITKARASAQEVSDLGRSESAAAAEKALSWGEGVQRSWKEHLAEVRQRADERKTEQAEYAVLARQDAQAVPGAAGG